MKTLKEQMIEMQQNRKHMLEAIRYLSERLQCIENKEHDLKDEIIVKNSDDISIIKKTKEDNAISIKKLEVKIDDIEKEIETRTANLEKELSKENARNQENVDKEKETKHR